MSEASCKQLSSEQAFSVDMAELRAEPESERARAEQAEAERARAAQALVAERA